MKTTNKQRKCVRIPRTNKCFVRESRTNKMLNGWHLLVCVAVIVVILNLRLIVLLPNVDDRTVHDTPKTIRPSRDASENTRSSGTQKVDEFVDAIDGLAERVEKLEQTHRSYMKEALYFITESKFYQQLSFALSTSTSTTTIASTTLSINNNITPKPKTKRSDGTPSPTTDDSNVCKSDKQYLATIGAPRDTMTANCFTQQKAYYDNAKGVEAVSIISFLILSSIN